MPKWDTSCSMHKLPHDLASKLRLWVLQAEHFLLSTLALLKSCELKSHIKTSRCREVSKDLKRPWHHGAHSPKKREPSRDMRVSVLVTYSAVCRPGLTAGMAAPPFFSCSARSLGSNCRGTGEGEAGGGHSCVHLCTPNAGATPCQLPPLS